MADPALDTMVQSLLRTGLITQSQLDESWDGLDPRAADREDLLNALMRRNFLTKFQKEKLTKGELSGLVLGGYHIKYKIASGSFGRVYRGEDPRVGQSVAVKVLRQRWTSDPHTIDLFQREAKVGMTLHHANIVQILAVDWDRASNQYFMVMEFVQGGNLRQILNSHKKLEPGRALAILEDAAAGLAHAHSRGVTHRDIKMSNVLISVDGTAKLVDFGLAGMMPAYERQPGMPINGQIEVERTVEYAGLEKATGVEPNDTRSDIFFLGCVTYEMLAGRAPLRKPKDRHDRMSPNRFSQVPQLPRDDVAAPPSLFDLVATMMAFNPRQRYQTPWQLLEAVRAARRDLDGAGRASGEVPRNRPTVFVVEGDQNLQGVLRDRLPGLGYRLLLASHPARALDQYRQQPYDALLVDVGSAGEDGLIVCEQVLAEAERRGRRCAALVVFSQEQAAWRERLPQRPDVAVLVRKFTLQQLTDTLQQLAPARARKSAAGQ